ncbi:thiamine diphosphokinase [Lactococcus kimchii]|uniref:thiamine diphosphokinase n=1 Tax=Lactococcus sp. S-13 TaxID=2507158 RepID=UPI001023B35A|nr:thiamine diphosphokinase [Lactococcus sp. S-13]RZI49028.1 thiamine diphosphokinase [Lactococcus sp. S-13]
MKILLVAGSPDFIPSETFDKCIGVDRGALFLLETGRELSLAVGDFDSVTAKEFLSISEATEQLIKLPAEKDVTDLEAALDVVLERFPEAELTIAGALGGRLDHLLTNVFLATRPKYQKLAPRLTLVDGQNVVRYLLAGKHTLKRLEGYKYIGFVQVESQDTLAISQAKYPLKAADNFSPIYASNEFISDQMMVSLELGMVIVIYSRDKFGGI